MNKSIVLYLLLAGLLTCFSCTHTKQQPEEEGVDSEWLDSLQHVYQYGICIDSLDVTEYKMRNGDNPAAIFSALGFSALKADSITKASIHVLNPTKLRAGMNYYTFIHFFEYERKVDFETFERLKLHRAESVDSAYNSDELYNVVYFKDYNIYLKFTGKYDRYGLGNHDYDGSIREVFPKEVTVIQYN